MKILTRYIGKTIIGATVLVMLVVLGLEILVEFSREFADLGVGYYGLLQVLAYVPMMLPFDLYQFFPMAGLLGCMVGLGLLAANNELIVMRTSGVSIVDVAIAVIKVAFVLTIVMVLVGEVLAPIVHNAAMRSKTAAMSRGQALMTKKGLWVRNGKDFFHIARVVAEGETRGITRYKFDEQRELLAASVAERGIYSNGQWVFKNITETRFTKNRINRAHINEQSWGLTLNPHLLGVKQVDSRQQTLKQLHAYINYLHQSGLNADSYIFIFWRRIFQPAAAFVMIILAVPFVFGPLRSVTTGLRVLTGVIIGFAFHILNQFAGTVGAVYQVPPIVAAALPTLVFGIIGCVFLIRNRV